MPRSVHPLSGILKFIGFLLLLTFVAFALCARGRPRSEWMGGRPTHEHR
jgi:hypothetical protein